MDLFRGLVRIPWGTIAVCEILTHLVRREGGVIVRLRDRSVDHVLGGSGSQEAPKYDDGDLC